MTDLEINKALALAIGWEKEQVVLDIRNSGAFCLVDITGIRFASWKVFNYRDWNVIGPIAKRYGMNVCFKNNIAWTGSNSVGTRGNTPQQAIALAVIGAAK